MLEFWRQAPSTPGPPGQQREMIGRCDTRNGQKRSCWAPEVSGYEESPDYGGPEPTWWGMVGVVILMLTVCGAIAFALNP